MKNAGYEISDEEEAEIQRMIASDPDNPELTEEQLASMRPFKEVFPELYESMKEEFVVESLSPMREVTLRLETDVIEKFKATGDDWEMQINQILRHAKI